GDVLAELDTTAERLSLEEERTRRASILPQINALESQMTSERAGVGGERRVLDFSKQQALAQYEEAEAQALLAEQEWERAKRLRAEGILAQADAERAKSDAQSKRASAEKLKVAISTLEPALEVREHDRDVQLKQIAAEKAKLEADIAISDATIKRLENEIERRYVRAPVSGKVAECANLTAGSHIAEGQQLAVILPPGKVRAVAEFDPSSALGKLHAGQRATLRLEGFPWAEYGTIAARITRVADEIRDGKARVEFELTSVAPSRIPVQHGLPATVEVEVERTTPAALVLRSAGTILGAH
ncbi:MAG: HlyD family efflux transporter periplasmic adaptor subunit, partial [Acidobacteriaceae bacterium]|nr:HlyD family efflux transporter periplasmic adaptor subunit [Acidobacteriaceae bacterium]